MNSFTNYKRGKKKYYKHQLSLILVRKFNKDSKCSISRDYFIYLLSSHFIRCRDADSLRSVLSNPVKYAPMAYFTCSVYIYGGESGIRTHEATDVTYTLSKRAPSTTQPSLHCSLLLYHNPEAPMYYFAVTLSNKKHISFGLSMSSPVNFFLLP